MSATSQLARLGLRLGTLGSAASLAIAAPLAEGQLDQAAHTDASRIGVHFDRTASAEGMIIHVMGTDRVKAGVLGLEVLSGVLTVPAGSAGAPSITTTGDLNTGVYFPAADQMALATGGVARATITTTGITTALNVGVNTAASSSTNLILPASTTGVSSLRIVPGVAPTTPVDGDIWVTATGFNVQVNGSTQPVIGGTATSTRVAFGDTAANTLTSNAALTYTTASMFLQNITTATAGGATWQPTFFRATWASSGTSVTSLIGSEFQADSTGTGTNTGVIIGASITAAHNNSSGTLSEMKGINVSVSGASGSTTTSFYGAYVASTISAGHTATTAYGLYVLTSNSGTVGTLYGVYQDDATALNYFTGVMGVGVAPSASTYLNLGASTTSVSSLRMAHGTAPSSPVNGDLWTTTSGIFARINGSTVGPFTATTPGGSDTQIQYNNAGAFGGIAGFTYTPAGATTYDFNLTRTDTTSQSSGQTNGTMFVDLALDVSGSASSGFYTAHYVNMNVFDVTGTSSTNASIRATQINLDTSAITGGTWNGPITGLYVLSRNAGGASGVTGIQVEADGGAQPITAGLIKANKSVTGTSSAATAVYAQVVCGAGTITDGYGVRVLGNNSAGTMTTFYGVYIDASISAGTGYGIYQAGAADLNFFAGVTGLGVAPSTTTFAILGTSTTAKSSMRIPHGVAPSAPVDGDVWTTTSGFFVRINGVTVQSDNVFTGSIADTQVAVGSGVNALSGSALLTFTSATLTTLQAATQDAISLTGRAGGTSSFGVTITPGVLTSSITLTSPLASGTLTTGSSATNRVAVWGGTNSLTGFTPWQYVLGSGSMNETYAAGINTSTVTQQIRNTTVNAQGVLGAAGVITLGYYNMDPQPTSAVGAGATYYALSGIISNTSVTNQRLATASMYGVNASCTFNTATSASAGVLTDMGGLIVNTSIVNTSAANDGTITNAYGINIVPGVFSTASGGTTTITNYYGLRIQAVTGTGAGTFTVTNRWGIYQDSTVANNFFGGVVQVPAGTVSLPGLTSNADTDTGVYWSAANTLDFTTAGVNRLSIATNGTFTGIWSVIAAATQDAVNLQGRAGGTSSFTATITPGVLTSSITLTSPLVSGTLMTGSGTTNHVPRFTGTNSVGVQANGSWTCVGANSGMLESYSSNTSLAAISTTFRSTTAGFAGTLNASQIITGTSTALTLSATTLQGASTAIYGNTTTISTSASNAVRFTTSVIYATKEDFTHTWGSVTGTNTILQEGGGKYITVGVVSGSTSGTQTTDAFYGINIVPGTFSSASGGTAVITNFYGLRIQTLTTSGAGTFTITNRYGIYQDDTSAVNFFGGTLLGPNGSASLPTHSFTGDTDTGGFNVGANAYGISAAGVLRLQIDTTRVISTVPFLAPDGSAASPSWAFANDTATGGYLVTTSSYGIATAGTRRFYANTTSINSELIHNFKASASGAASINIAQGSAPSSPNSGDIWLTATGIGGVYARISSTTHVMTSIVGANQIAFATAAQTTLIGSTSLTFTDVDGGQFALTRKLSAGVNNDTVGSTGASLSSNYSGSTNGPGEILGASVSANWSSSGTMVSTQVRGLNSSASISAATAVTGIGISGVVLVGNTATPTNIYAMYATATVQSGGTATNSYGLYVLPDSQTGSTVTTSYGVYIAAPTNAGVITTEYGIYQASTTATNFFGGVLRGPAGAVGAPTFSTTGDTNTGIYFSAADTIDITTGGTNQLSISTTVITAALSIAANGGVVIASGQDLQVGNAYVNTPQVPTGYIIIKDSTGTAYKVSVNV